MVLTCGWALIGRSNLSSWSRASLLVDDMDFSEVELNTHRTDCYTYNDVGYRTMLLGGYLSLSMDTMQYIIWVWFRLVASVYEEGFDG